MLAQPLYLIKTSGVVGLSEAVILRDDIQHLSCTSCPQQFSWNFLRRQIQTSGEPSQGTAACVSTALPTTIPLPHSQLRANCTLEQRRRLKLFLWRKAQRPWMLSQRHRFHPSCEYPAGMDTLLFVVWIICLIRKSFKMPFLSIIKNVWEPGLCLINKTWQSM